MLSINDQFNDTKQRLQQIIHRNQILKAQSNINPFLNHFQPHVRPANGFQLVSSTRF